MVKKSFIGTTRSPVDLKAQALLSELISNQTPEYPTSVHTVVGCFNSEAKNQKPLKNRLKFEDQYKAFYNEKDNSGEIWRMKRAEQEKLLVRIYEL